MTPLAFHAAPPAGEWLNDPNVLGATPGGYRLYAQHRADPPDFRATGWGMFESGDLLGWRWAGVALPAEAGAWAYSGSGVRTRAGLELFHTVHDPHSGLQHQRHLLPDTGSWQRAPDDTVLARPIANRRDPFVFAWQGEWRMLLTQSCDWHGWRDDPPSYLVVLASVDRRHWREVGRIGPWHAAGVMWEVPVMVRLDGTDVLFLSLVDRRDDGATCSVYGWAGRFDGEAFAVDPAFPAGGQLVDLGPDYYAQVPGIAGDWPAASPFVAWAASWATARAPIWPGFAGGPITLPRSIEVRRVGAEMRLWSTPWPALLDHFGPVATRPESGRGTASLLGSAPYSLTVAGQGGVLRVSGDPGSGTLTATREAADGFGWSADHPGAVLRSGERHLSLFIDGPLIELFDESSGSSLTAALPGGVASVHLDVQQTPVPFAWSSYTA